MEAENLESLLTAEDELDLSDAGIQERDETFTITDVQKEDTENGTRYNVTFESPGVDFPVTERFWYAHKNTKAQEIGRGTLKKIGVAAVGAAKFSPSALIGRQLRARLYDRNGFVALKNFATPAA